MEYLHTIILGLIQGLTEFLPVSSSGHLLLTEYLFQIKSNLNLEIFLHTASLLAVLIFFRKEILEIIREIFDPKRFKNSLGLKLIVATLATIPLALFLEAKVLSTTALNLDLVALTLALTGILIWLAEKYRPVAIKDFTWLMAIALGLIQGLTVLPGISRSGLTIVFLIFLGIQRRQAVQISFLLAIPTILGATVFSLSQTEKLASLWSTEFMLGGLVSFVAALLAIKFMLQAIQKHWVWFAPYCLFLSGIIICLF